MNQIQIRILNPESIYDVKKMMVAAARLTQRGAQVESMSDFCDLYNKQYTNELIANLVSLPHPTLQKLGVINIAVVGASRRFLAQITRHQNEVKFISASLQYSDYSDVNRFCVPYEIIRQGQECINSYIAQCKQAMLQYKKIAAVAGNDAAGYLAPQGLRNVLLISATPYQWKHMIAQRTCRRNTLETRYVMLKIWEALSKIDESFFNNSGPFCTYGACQEGKMCCQQPMAINMSPKQILDEDFSLIGE